MNIPVIDRSNYLKGLFITAKLDKELSQKEKDILRKISDKLGFATDFYDETVRSLLTNKYIKEEPIVFSDKKIARSFLNDAIKLACSNNVITEAEINWLKNTATANELNSDLVDKGLKSFQDSPNSFFSKEFALFSII
jgi:tellurite resistance protein